MIDLQLVVHHKLDLITNLYIVDVAADANGKSIPKSHLSRLNKNEINLKHHHLLSDQKPLKILSFNLVFINISHPIKLNLHFNSRQSRKFKDSFLEEIRRFSSV